MAKDKKQETRRRFRDAVFRRDRYQCVGCGLKLGPENAEAQLDAHHITPRENMPNGGYVPENGVSLCKEVCHIKAEEALQQGLLDGPFSPRGLYAKIGSSVERAIKASGR